MNGSKGFLIFSLFVLGVSVICFVVTSYQLRHPVEPEGALELHEEEVAEMPHIHKRSVFSENTDQSNDENIAVENEDDSETGSDVPVDLRGDALTDDFELQRASEALADALSPEVKLKAERYAKLAQILPTIEELKERKFKLTKQYEKDIWEDNQRRRLHGPPYPEPDSSIEEVYQATVKIIDKEVSDYNRQIDNMFPELDITYEEQGIGGYIFVLRKDQVLREYFGKKLPFDGNPDYFSLE